MRTSSAPTPGRRSRTSRCEAPATPSTGTARSSVRSSRANRTRTTTAPSGTSALRIADGVIYLADEAPAYGAVAPTGPGAAVSLMLPVPDVDATLAAAVREGATARRPRGVRGVRQPQRVVRRPVRPPVGHQQPRTAVTVGLTLVTETPPDALPEADLPEQLRIRREKRDRLLAAGIPPYPVSVPRTHSLAQVREQWGHLEQGEETQDVVGVAGRVVFVRNTGKLAFATLQEGVGTRLQVMLSLAEVGEEALAAWKADVDLGDHVFVEGRVISSRRGELSVMASRWGMASKALRPLPVLHKELSEESRVRQRYADLVVRQEARDMVRTKATALRAIRPTLERPGLRRGRDAGHPARARWRRGPPVPHPHERLRPRDGAAHRPRAQPQEGRRRRGRPGLRDGPDLPQRGRRRHPLPRVHDARGLPGVGRPDLDRRPDPRPLPRRGRRARLAGRRDPRRHRRPRRRVALAAGLRRGERGGRRDGHPRDAEGDPARVRRDARRRGRPGAGEGQGLPRAARRAGRARAAPADVPVRLPRDRPAAGPPAPRRRRA